MIIRLVSLKCKPQDVDAFRLVLRQAFPRVTQTPGCLSLQIVGDVADPTSFYTISAWRDVDALEAYRGGPLFAEIWPRVKMLLREPAWASTCQDIKETPGGCAPGFTKPPESPGACTLDS